MSVDYYNPGIMPVYFGVCFSEKEWGREFKRLDVQDPPENPASMGKDANVTFLESDTKMPTILMFIDSARIKNYAPSQVSGLIAHEAEHCTQYALRAMGEEYPGDETRSYMNQFFVQTATQSWEKHRKRSRKK